MNINSKLKRYIEKQIFPQYLKNDLGHNIDHIQYVIKRSLNFAKSIPDINLDMVYTIAAYHDIGHHIDAENHEKVSSEMMLNDQKLREFFSEEQIRIMAEAIHDHRASLEYEPRNIYGKIVSSADRNVLVDIPLKRTYAYRVEHNDDYFLSSIISESRQHLIKKFGKKGYANEKMYFEDKEYKEFLESINDILIDEEAFIERYLITNDINDSIYKEVFQKLKNKYPMFSLDQLLYETYLRTRVRESDNFDQYRIKILEANNIDELEYYTKNVNPGIKEYVETYIFPQYSNNDGAHGIVHIIEVIRRSFALNDTFKLNLNHNMIYVIAAYHDLGKHEDHENHHLIGAQKFIQDKTICEFFTQDQITIIKEAIEDHRSSKEDEPRSTYGKLISSADRNTSIDIVFIRSFFVAKERQPETNIEDYLDYTIKRLSKKYDEENPENMFYEDQTYQEFIKDMRDLLKREEEFKNRYCTVNHITSRANKVGEEQGEISYTKILKIGEIHEL